MTTPSHQSFLTTLARTQPADVTLVEHDVARGAKTYRIAGHVLVSVEAAIAQFKSELSANERAYFTEAYRFDSGLDEKFYVAFVEVSITRAPMTWAQLMQRAHEVEIPYAQAAE